MATHVTPSLSFGDPDPEYAFTPCGDSTRRAYDTIQDGGRAHVDSEPVARGVMLLLGLDDERIDRLVHFGKTGAWPSA
jgi:hypothetical protein